MTPVRSAEIVMDIRPYRFGLLERIAARSDIDHVIYAGLAAPGQGAPSDRPQVPLEVRPIVNRFWFRRPLKVMWQSGALAVLRSEADVIVCQEVVSNLTVWLIRLLHRRFGKSLVLIGFFYRPEERTLLTTIRDRFRRALRSSASALIAYTDQGRSELIGEGVDPQKIFVNGNTLDTQHLMAVAQDVTASESDRMRSDLGIGPQVVVLAFLGRLRPIKKVEVAIAALRLLGEGYALLVIGDGEEAGRLRAMVGDLPIKFLGQTYDDVTIARWLSIASMLVMPGSVGLTCVHGFASGLPCITTSDRTTTQTPEFAYVEHDVNGLVLQRPDPHLYAEAIAGLAVDRERLDRLSAGALATAGELDMDRMADAFAAAIRQAHESVSRRRLR